MTSLPFISYVRVCIPNRVKLTAGDRFQTTLAFRCTQPKTEWRSFLWFSVSLCRDGFMAIPGNLDGFRCYVLRHTHTAAVSTEIKCFNDVARQRVESLHSLHEQSQTLSFVIFHGFLLDWQFVSFTTFTLTLQLVLPYCQWFVFAFEALDGMHIHFTSYSTKWLWLRLSDGDPFIVSHFTNWNSVVGLVMSCVLAVSIQLPLGRAFCKMLRFELVRETSRFSRRRKSKWSPQSFWSSGMQNCY